MRKPAKRNVIISIAVAVAMLLAMVGTTYLCIKSNSAGNPMQGNQPAQSEQMNGSTDQQPSEQPEGQQAGDSQEQPPEKPDGDNQEQPPEKPDGQQTGDSQEQPPEKPDGDSQEQPPEKPEGQQADDDQEQPPEMPGGEQGGSMTLFYILFGIEGLVFALAVLYLIMSRWGKRPIKGKKQLVLMIVIALVVGGVTAYGCPTAIGKVTKQEAPSMGEQSTSDIEAEGAIEVEDTQTLDGDYESTGSDENVILVKNGGKATISGNIDKKSGDSSNTNSSDFSGVNAGILVQENSNAVIDGADITTNVKGGNAVFATGENANVKISNSTIKTSGESSSRGLDATYGGTIEADNVTIETSGGSCAALATDRGEGTVSASNSKLTTNGAGSPVIYSTGNISIEKCKGKANGSQITVVEGKNTATVNNSTVVASGKGNRGDVDGCGVMIYQSMSGDADEGVGTFSASDSTLKISESSDLYDTVPFFFITNTDAVINLKNSTLKFGSGTLLNAAGTDQWGNEGSNGGNVELNAESQKLEGDMEIDKLSSLVLNLKTGSSYKGAINSDNTDADITLSLSEDSTVTLTGDTYITKLDNEDSNNSNINFNGYKLYVNGKAVNN